MGQTASSSPSSPPPATAPASCPVPHNAAAHAPAKCPVPHDAPSSSSSSSSTAARADRPAECPIKHDSSDALNPRNNIPALAQTRAAHQAADLPTERTASSIPRPDGDTPVWEYPSPQQFYNALVRKGWETPEEHVETMVEIHNFLNEEAWNEVLKWERRHDSQAKVELSRFKGRPGELSPKARFMMFAGWLLPSRFNTEPPFDRHDWIVRRPTTGEEVRYVIDYYSAPPEPDGSPVFSLDVRPALDSVGSIRDRIAVATADAWAGLREQQKGSRSTSGGI